jgi:catechol 2,3-dioxygenase-like lactoylglutathione lyase family enzyme
VERAKVRIGSVVIDVKDFEVMRDFWQKALGYDRGRPPEAGDPFPATILRDPAGRGPNVITDLTEPCRNALHIDLYAEDYDAGVGRLLGLGATVYRARESDEGFVVLADPEGNLFRVVDAEPSSPTEP